ncbi:hypothetical protein LINGRAHAP2_LOCUS20854 [Linum grandiflorum]
MSEARTILEASKYTRNNNQTALILSDCQELIAAINKRSLPEPWQCYSPIASIRANLLAAPNVALNFTPRLGNMKADWDTKTAKSGSLTPGWVLSCNL